MGTISVAAKRWGWGEGVTIEGQHQRVGVLALFWILSWYWFYETKHVLKCIELYIFPKVSFTVR